jgi:pimeloyl-ACP methyl ester carboxylesterase
VIEYPVFIPFGGDHLAGVVTVPEVAPRGFVLLLQGAGGAPRTHRYRLWTRAARGLSEVGIASIRMDYPGIGDSTGSYSFAMEAPPVEEAEAVARLGLERLGVDSFGVVGNCIGARTALVLASRMKECVSAACILPVALGPVLAGRGRSPGLAARLISRMPSLGHVLKRATRRLDQQAAFIPEALPASRDARLMFLHGGTEQTWQQLRGAAARLDAESKTMSGVEVLPMPSEGRSGFRPLETQRTVIDSIVRWMDATLPERVDAVRSQPGAA